MSPSLKPARRNFCGSTASPTPAEKPTPASPINDTAIFFAPPEGEARLQLPLPRSERCAPA